MKQLSKIALMLGVSAALGTTAVEASHFRGGSIVPTIDASGLMTTTVTTYWRKTFVGTSIKGGLGSIISNTVDQSDARFAIKTEIYTRQLSGAGTYALSADSCCRVSGIANVGATSWRLDSTIVWDGSNAAAPILFDFSAVNPEVVRGAAYNDSLGATSGSGLTLSYNQALNGINSQPVGFVVNTTTGALSIDAASTASSYSDNLSNVGADVAFSGQILASDGSMVEFDWLFDGVNTGSNLAPNVGDQVINALVGDIVTTTVTGTDPNGDSLTWDLLSFFGPLGVLTPTFDPLTQLLTWDTTGLSDGDTLIANVRANDGSLTDVGTITINIHGTTPPVGVPEPGTLLLLGLGLTGLGFSKLRKKKQS